MISSGSGRQNYRGRGEQCGVAHSPCHDLRSIDPLPLDEAIDVVRELNDRSGGPEPSDYVRCFAAMAGISVAKVTGQFTREEHVELMASLGPAGSPLSLMGHIFHKPYGYDGDFDIIDKLYTQHVSSDRALHNWDVYVQSLPTADAVRNRGLYLASIVRVLLAAGSGTERPLRVASLGSGPGRDLETALQICTAEGLLAPSAGRGSDGKGVLVTCIDQDHRALTHSARVLARFGECVRFRQADVLRLRLNEPVDLVWSSGLFDYFSDRLFVRTLGRLRKALVPGGRMVVGNFSDGWPVHSPMSFGDWHLVFRGEALLRSLAHQAGVDEHRVRIDAEPTGINLFLDITEGADS